MPTRRTVHFFKIAFSRTDVVADFIGAFLSPDFSNQVDLSTLSRISDSYVDEQLSQHYVDLLYSVQYGNVPVTIALLFEHKSYVEEYPHFQLMRYMLNYWQSQLTNKEVLTPIVPILLFHGRGNWQQRPMPSYFTQADSFLKQFIPDFDYLLINLRKAPDEQFSLLRNNYAKVTAGLLKTIRERQQLTRLLEELATTIESLVDTPDGQQFIKTAFLYVHWTSKLTAAEMVAIFDRISPKSAEVVMSAAEVLIKQGDHQATVQHVKGLLEMGLDKNLIAKAFGLTMSQLDAIIREIKGE